MSKNNRQFARTQWLPTCFRPVLSGSYEFLFKSEIIKGVLVTEEVTRMTWNGKIWLSPSGAALANKELRNAHWRGLTRAGYEEACRASGTSALFTGSGHPTRPHDKEGESSLSEDLEFSQLPSIDAKLPIELKVGALRPSVLTH